MIYYLFDVKINKEIDFKWFNLYENSPEYGINFGLKDEDEIFLQLNDERLKAHTLGVELTLDFIFHGRRVTLHAKDNEKIDDVFDRYTIKVGNFGLFFLKSVKEEDIKK